MKVKMESKGKNPDALHIVHECRFPLLQFITNLDLEVVDSLLRFLHSYCLVKKLGNLFAGVDTLLRDQFASVHGSGLVENFLKGAGQEIKWQQILEVVASWKVGGKRPQKKVKSLKEQKRETSMVPDDDSVLNHKFSANLGLY